MWRLSLDKIVRMPGGPFSHNGCSTTLVYPKTLRDATIAEIQEALLWQIGPAQFELVERARFHTLDRNFNETLRAINSLLMTPI